MNFENEIAFIKPILLNFVIRALDRIMGMPYDHGFLGILAPNNKPKASLGFSVFVLVSLLPLYLIEDRKIPH